MAVNGMVCIYRMDDDAVSGTAHEDAARHVTKLEIGRGSTTPDAYSAPDGGTILTGFGCPVSRKSSENPAPLLDDARLPDVGYGGVTYDLHLSFRMQSNRYLNMPKGLKLLFEWAQESSDVKGSFPNGRFGIRNDALPFADCEPKTEGGYKMTRVTPNWNLNTTDAELPVTVSFRQGGPGIRLNTGWYASTVDAEGFGATYLRTADGTRPAIP